MITNEEYLTNIKKRIAKDTDLMCLALGLGGEAGEVLDALKKKIYHHKPTEDVKFLDELGDVLWYLTLMLDHFDYSIEDCMEYNDRKLEARYPQGFSPEASIAKADRNLS